MAATNDEKMMLAVSSLETEFQSQETTILLFLCHNGNWGSASGGREIEPSTNLILFLAPRAISVARRHEG